MPTAFKLSFGMHTNVNNHIEHLFQTLITIDGMNVKYFLDRDDTVAWLTAFFKQHSEFKYYIQFVLVSP